MILNIFCLLTGFLFQVFGQPPVDNWKSVPFKDKKVSLMLDTIQWTDNQYAVGILEDYKGVAFIKNKDTYIYKSNKSKTIFSDENTGGLAFAIKVNADAYHKSKQSFKKDFTVKDLDFLFDNNLEQEFYMLRGKVKSATIQIPASFNDDKEHNWHEHLDKGITGTIKSQIVEVFCFKSKINNETKYYYFLKLRYGKLGGLLLDFTPLDKMTIIKPTLF